MKHFLKIILDGLTYPDLDGRRRPRVFTLLTLAILGLLLLTGGLIPFQRQRVMQPVESNPVPVSLTQVPPDPTPEPITEPGPVSCPTDPADWSLADVTITGTYQAIQPACVYAGLERMVAWALAVRSGYPRQEATQFLGFPSMPVTPLEKVSLPSGKGEPREVAVSFAPTHPDLAEWRVDGSGNVATAYGLRGCFRTLSVSGNRVETWGGDYPVICVVVEDAGNTHAVYALEGHVFTAAAIPTRTYLLFGYAGDDRWHWLGAQENPRITLSDPAKAARDRRTVAVLFDGPSWEAPDLMAAYHLTPRPLPESWRTSNDPAEAQAILGLLDAHLKEDGQ